MIDAWARKHNTAWVLGETGLSNYSAKIDKTWVRRTYQLMKKYKRCGVLLLQHRAEQQGRLDLGDAEQDD